MVDTLKIIIDTKAKGDGPKKAKTGLEGVAKAAKLAAGAFALIKSAQVAVDFAKFGANVKRQANSLDSLAKAAGTSGKEIVDAIQGASNFTIDRMTAMEAANKAMMLDVAKSPAAFEELATVATALGKAMGQDAAKSIEDFTVAAGRQSMQIADNLGLTVQATKANARYAKENNKLADTLTTAEKKQAFLNEMLRQGNIKMAELGDGTLDAAGKIEKAEAAISDLKTASAEAFISAAENVNIFGLTLDNLGDRLRALPETVEQVSMFGVAFLEASRALKTLKNPMDAWNDSLRRQVALLDDSNPEIERYASATKKLGIDTSDAVSEITYMTAAVNTNVISQGDLMHTVLGAAKAIEEEEAAIEANIGSLGDMERRTLEADSAMQDLGVSMSSFFRQSAKNRQDAATEIEKIEADHQANVAELQSKGQATSIRIDEVAEQTKLATLKRKLEIALQQQSEFTDKTKASTQMAKADQIARLQAQIGEQATLLDDYYAGRLVNQGANITAEMAAENERYAAALEIAQAQNALREEEELRSLGQIALQHFDSWAAINGVTGEQALAMRLKIQEEYGLISEEGAAMALNLNDAFDAMAISQGDSIETVRSKMDLAITSANNLGAAIAGIPDKTVNIDVRIKTHGGVESAVAEGMGPAVGLATGTNFARGGMTIVGERGPELVDMPRGARVFDARKTDQILGGSNTAPGTFQSSRGQLQIPGGMGGGGIGGGFSQVWHNSFFISEQDPELLAKKIAESERLHGAREAV